MIINRMVLGMRDPITPLTRHLVKTSRLYDLQQFEDFGDVGLRSQRNVHIETHVSYTSIKRLAQIRTTVSLYATTQNPVVGSATKWLDKYEKTDSISNLKPCGMARDLYISGKRTQIQ